MKPALSIKQEQARRAAQSKKDKARNKQGGRGGATAPGTLKVVPKQPRNRSREGRTELGPSGPGNSNLAGKGSTRNSTTNRRKMIIEEDEYIAEVTVANQPNFNNTQYSVNPGQVGTFPWLSTIAARFEKYRFDYLEFYYKREVSEFATNGQVGKVIMSFDTDASDAAPATKQQMEDTDPHVDALPSENMRLVIPRAMLQTQLDSHYVRPGALPGNADIKTYDVGNLNVATQVIANNVAVGELHVRYRVELSIPVLENAGGLGASQRVAFFQATSPGEAAGATTVAKQMLFATASQNGLGVVNTAGSFVPPVGNYLVSIQVDALNTVNIAKQQMDFQKNGASVFQVVPLNAANVGSEPLSLQLSASVAVQANGSDAFTVIVTDTYASGTQTNSGEIVWQSV